VIFVLAVRQKPGIQSVSTWSALAAAVQVAGIDEGHARRLFQEMVTAVDYCHRLGIVNRDIKLDNLMLDTSAEPTLKICDFGAMLSRI
jgi:serine/threonine protein kinase